MDYVSKWVEAVATRTNNHKVVVKFIQENIFSRFGMPRAIISDGDSYFCNRCYTLGFRAQGRERIRLDNPVLKRVIN